MGWQSISAFTNANYGSGKGLELVPVDRVELSVSAPSYLTHTKPGVNDGIGDMAFLFKYRAAAGNPENGNYVVTAMFAATVPTGAYTNGAKDALLTPTLAVGKGWGNFDLHNEPLITSEWAVAIFKEAKAAGLATGFVSNGNGTPQVLDFVCPYQA